MSDMHTHLPVRKYAPFNSGLGEEKEKNLPLSRSRVSLLKVKKELNQ